NGVYLIKTDAGGDTLWTKAFGGTGDEEGFSVVQSNDSGYIVCGYTNSLGVNLFDVYLIKTDIHGDTLWTKTYGGIDGDAGYSVKQTGDGGYFIAGNTASFDPSQYVGGIYLMKTDAD